MSNYTSPYQELYLERCVKTDSGYKPTFWNPQPVVTESFCLYGDESMTVDPQWSCDKVINRLIALGLELELEVGEFVRDASAKDLPQDDHLKKLLQSNIADEAKHYKGFVYAREAYPVSNKSLTEAANIRSQWQTLANIEHPLLIAMAMEIGVFLPFLGCTRLFGGKSLATLSRKVAEDEYRHILTNRTLLDDLEIDAWNLPTSVNKLIQETVAWAIDDLYIPDSEVDEDFDLDFVLRASKELITTGEAQDYDDLVYVADHVLPFEVSNASQYDRVLD